MARPPSKSRPEPEEFDLESATSGGGAGEEFDLAEAEEFDLEQATEAAVEPEELDLEAATKKPSPPRRELPSLPQLVAGGPVAPPGRGSVTNEGPRASRTGEEFDLDLAHLPAEERAELERKAEVEAAIASLEGRDPTRAMGDLLARRERDRFEGQLKSAVKSAKASAEQDADRRRKRLPLVILAVAAVAAAGIVAYVKISANLEEAAALRGATSAAAAAFGARGFTELEIGAEGSLAVAGEADHCYVAVVGSTEASAKLRVERDGRTVEGRQVGWCSCGASSATVTRLAPEGAAVAVYAAPIAKAGGAAFLEALEPRDAERLGEQGGGACVESLLDRYVTQTPIGGAPERGDVRHGALTGAGLTVLGGAGPDERFVALPAKPKSCVVVDSSDPEETLVLRLAGGETPLVESPVVAVCQDKPVQGSVWRKGRGTLSVYTASLDALGGSVGLGEVLARAGAAGAPIHRTEDAIAQEPTASLGASGILGAYLVEAGGRSRLGSPDPPHLFAFSASDGAYASKISTTRGAIACRPDLSSSPAAALCVGAAGVFDGLVGVRAERPQWLPGSTEPEALARALDVLSLARRLTLAGFELTTVDGVVETPTGATITGRAEQKQVVAIALSNAPPYLHTLSDGAAWSIEGEPRLVPVSPGGQVSLVASPAFTGPKVPRSIVVFRR